MKKFKNKSNMKKIKKMTNSIHYTNKFIEDFISKSKNYTRVILIGSTGVGKSTIANAIIGNELIIEEDDFGIFLNTKETKFSMGKIMKSTTTIPNMYVDEKLHLLICDAPGFLDNRGPKQETLNSFSIDQLFNSECKIKIILVISQSEASISQRRGAKVIENIERILNIIPNEKELEQGLCMIISNSEFQTPREILSELIKGNPNQNLIKWCNFFINHENERLFNFPRASYDEIGKNYIFDDRNRLLRFLRTSPIINPTHQVVLSVESQLQIIKVANNYGSIEILLKKFIKACRKKYRLESFKDWIEWSKSFHQIHQNLSNIKNPRDLGRIIDNYIKHSKDVDKRISKIYRYDCIFQFMNHIEGFEKVHENNIEEQSRKVFSDEINIIEQTICLKKSRIFIYEKEKEYQKKKEVFPVLIDEVSKSREYVNQFRYRVNSLTREFNAGQARNNDIYNRILNIDRQIEVKDNEINAQLNEINLMSSRFEEQKRRNRREINRLTNEHENQKYRFSQEIEEAKEQLKVQEMSNILGIVSPFYHLFRKKK